MKCILFSLLCVTMEQTAEIHNALYMNRFHKANWLFFKEFTSNKGAVFKQRCKHKLWPLSSLKAYDLSCTVLRTGRKGSAELLCRKRGPCRSEVGPWHHLQLSHRQVGVGLNLLCLLYAEVESLKWNDLDPGQRLPGELCIAGKLLEARGIHGCILQEAHGMCFAVENIYSNLSV